jgi:hypothetical protein
METVSMKRKKAGRPAKAIKKEVRACVRFTRPEYFIIKEKAAKAGRTASAYLRQVAIYATVTTRLTEEERQFVRQLIGMANNLNQLAKSCHQEGALRAMLYFENYRRELDDILKKLRP